MSTNQGEMRGDTIKHGEAQLHASLFIEFLNDCVSDVIGRKLEAWKGVKIFHSFVLVSKGTICNTHHNTFFQKFSGDFVRFLLTTETSIQPFPDLFELVDIIAPSVRSIRNDRDVAIIESRLVLICGGNL